MQKNSGWKKLKLAYGLADYHFKNESSNGHIEATNMTNNIYIVLELQIKCEGENHLLGVKITPKE